MVLPFNYPILFLILLLMFGQGDAVRDLEEKYSFVYDQITIDSVVEGQENSKIDEVGDEKSSSQSSISELMKDFETHFRENVNDHQFEETKSSHQPSSPHHHTESAEVGLFTIDDLRGFHVGKKLPIFFPIRDLSLYPPFFLPKKLAETIPFSTSQASAILQLFSVSPDSPKGEAFRATLEACRSKGPQGETKICATSLESMLGFVKNAFGPEVDFKFITTSHPTITTPIFQNYTVLEPPREIKSAKKVACHPFPYFYAIYFCHTDANYQTKAFKLPLMGDSTGDKVEALVVCHMDTSGWSSNHIAFRMLGVKKGNSFCHVFRQGDIVWIQPSTLAAM